MSTKLSKILGSNNTLPQLTRARDVDIDAEVGERVFYDPLTKKIVTEYQGMSDIYKVDYYSSGWYPNSAVCYSDEPIQVKTSDGLYHIFILANTTDSAGTSHFLQAFTCVKDGSNTLKNTASTAFTTTSGVIGSMAITSAARVGTTDDYVFLVGEAYIDSGTNGANFCRATWNTSTQTWTFTRNSTVVYNNNTNITHTIIDVVYHATSSSVFAFLPDTTSYDIKYFRYDLAGDTVTNGTVSDGAPRRSTDQVMDIKKFSNVSMMAHVLSDDKFIIFGRHATGGVYTWSGTDFTLDQANPMSVNQSGEAYTVLMDGDPDAFIRMEDGLNLSGMDWRVFRYSGGTLTETAVQTNVDVTADGRTVALAVGSAFRWIGNNTIQCFSQRNSGDRTVTNITINDDDSVTARSASYFKLHLDSDYVYDFHQDEDGIVHSFSHYNGTNSTNMGHLAIVRGSAGAFLDDYRPIPIGYISEIIGTDYTYSVSHNYETSEGLTSGEKYGNSFALDDTIVLLQEPIVANYKRLNRNLLYDGDVQLGNTFRVDYFGDIGQQKQLVRSYQCRSLKAPENQLSVLLRPLPHTGTNGVVFINLTCDGLIFQQAFINSISTSSVSVAGMVVQSSIKTQAILRAGTQQMTMCLTLN